MIKLRAARWLFRILGFESPMFIKTYDGVGSEPDPWRDRSAHGALDTCQSHALYLRLEIMKRLSFSANEMCARCHFPWGLAKDHTTWGIGTGGGCIALCEDCWQELRTADNRIPYYRARWEKYWTREPWEVYEAAIRGE